MLQCWTSETILDDISISQAVDAPKYLCRMNYRRSWHELEGFVNQILSTAYFSTIFLKGALCNHCVARARSPVQDSSDVRVGPWNNHQKFAEYMGPAIAADGRSPDNPSFSIGVASLIRRSQRISKIQYRWGEYIVSKYPPCTVSGRFWALTFTNWYFWTILKNKDSREWCYSDRRISKSYQVKEVKKVGLGTAGMVRFVVLDSAWIIRSIPAFGHTWKWSATWESSDAFPLPTLRRSTCLIIWPLWIGWFWVIFGTKLVVLDSPIKSPFWFFQNGSRRISCMVQPLL